MRLDGRAACPGLECLVGFPLGDHEVALLALDRTQKLEAEESRLAVNGVSAMRESLLQFGTGARGHLDCVDLHHGHGARLPCLARASAGHARCVYDGRSAPERHLLGQRWRPVGARARADGPWFDVVTPDSVAQTTGHG